MIDLYQEILFKCVCGTLLILIFVGLHKLIVFMDRKYPRRNKTMADDGKVNYRCGAYSLNGKLIVRLEFDEPCKWVGMTIEEAEAMSEKLLRAVQEIKILEQL